MGRPSDLIKKGGGAQVIKVSLQNCLINAENVLQEQISIIDLSCYNIGLRTSK